MNPRPWDESCNIMKHELRAEYVTRETILKLLSDDEVSQVSTAESGTQLINGDEYIDLDKPTRGVMKAVKTSTAHIAGMLPRRAVSEKTWQQIVARFSAPRA